MRVGLLSGSTTKQEFITNFTASSTDLVFYENIGLLCKSKIGRSPILTLYMIIPNAQASEAAQNPRPSFISGAK